LLGRGNEKRRGNMIDGISERKRKTKKGKNRLKKADAHLNGKKVSELPSIDELNQKKCP